MFRFRPADVSLREFQESRTRLLYPVELQPQKKFQFFKTVCQFRYLDTSILRLVIGNKNCFRGCDLIFFTIDASLNCLKSTFLLFQNFSDNLYLGNVILQSLFMFVQNLFMAFKHLPQITCRSLVFLFIGWWSDKAFKQCFRFQLNL